MEYTEKLKRIEVLERLQPLYNSLYNELQRLYREVARYENRDH